MSAAGVVEVSVSSSSSLSFSVVSPSSSFFSIQVDVCGRSCGGLGLLLLLLVFLRRLPVLLLLLNPSRCLRPELWRSRSPPPPPCLSPSSPRPPPSPPAPSSPQVAGHRFSPVERIFPGRAFQGPCTRAGCHSQARTRSGSRQSCRTSPAVPASPVLDGGW